MKIIWGQYGGLPECPYFRKWVIDFGPFAIRLHRWYGDDDHFAMHDHPYWFYTFVLRGGYTDVSPKYFETVFDKPGQGKIGLFHRKLKAGQLRFRAAEYQHSVRQVLPNTWTLLLSGRPSRRWGFWVDNKLIKRDKYFAEYGHHPCDNLGEPVRMKPDGTRINTDA